MKLALAQVCSLNSPFEKDIEEYAAGQCHAIEVWLGKLESYLETHSTGDVRRLLDEHEVDVPVATFQGGLLSTQGDFRREHWNHFARRLQILRELGISTLVVAGDIAGTIDQQLLDRVQVSLKQAGELAGQHGVRLAIEFQARAAFGNNLQSMAWLVEQCGSGNVGLCLDLFHFSVGSSKSEDLAYLTNQNLFHVQLSDVAGQPRELATDADRVLPGDGDFALEPVIERLRQISYSGHVSVELMNPQLWQVPARSFGEVGMTALRKALGLASMDA